MMMAKGRVLFLLAIFLSLIGASCAERIVSGDLSESSVFKIVEEDEGFLVMESQKKVLYCRIKPASFSNKVSFSKDNQTKETLVELLQSFDRDSRPYYIHPLYGLDGEVLTEDFPLDHPHHHGIFWAWHQILVGEKQIGDGWDIRDFWWDVQDVKVMEASEGSLALRFEVLWKSPNWVDEKGKEKPFVKEVTVIKIHRVSEELRSIDFEIGLLALEDGVKIGGSDNKKGYSGFSARVRFPEDGLIFTGREGEVKPTNLAIEAGPWMDFSGNFSGNGKRSGLAILCHKLNPGYPTPWILRKRESMQNAVYPGREPVGLLRDKQTVLRYRLIIHRGDAKQIDFDKLLAEYHADKMNLQAVN
jgi:hypothetical protein